MTSTSIASPPSAMPPRSLRDARAQDSGRSGGDPSRSKRMPRNGPNSGLRFTCHRSGEILMRRLILIVLALAFAAPGVTAAAGAAILGDAAVAFSADRRLVIDDRSYSGRVFADPGRQRHEQILAGVR